MKLALKLVPQGLQERAKPFTDRFQVRVRDYEWTWTKAVVWSLGLWFLAMVFVAFIPSWWLYFADQKLGWHKCPCVGSTHWTILFWEIPIRRFWLFIFRDTVAVILFSIPVGGFVMVPYALQKLRRRLRSESESRPTGGYR
jgi:NhaP-type Na+/H+ or K+/H+ antiporter